MGLNGTMLKCRSRNLRVTSDLTTLPSLPRFGNFSCTSLASGVLTLNDVASLSKSVNILLELEKRFLGSFHWLVFDGQNLRLFHGPDS